MVIPTNPKDDAARTLFGDAFEWAQDNFYAVSLGHQQRRDRLVFSASQIALHPGASFPALFDPLDLRCFYSLMNRPESTHSSLLAAHTALSKRSMLELTGKDVVLLVSDTTEVDFTSHKALHEQLGPIGDGAGRGLLQHNTLAVAASDGLLLGLAYQILTNRQPAPPGETKSQRLRRKDRESQLWQQGFEGVGPAPQGAIWVDVCDRGADIFEALYASVRLGHHALFRVCQDRNVLVELPNGEFKSDKLMSLAHSLPVQVEDTVQVSQKGGRPARTARVKLAGCKVYVEVPVGMPQREQYKPIEVWVVRVWEENPPEGIEALQWVLISTLPAHSDEELLTRRDWYSRRWTTAEDYHQAEKTGCGLEKVRFQEVEALKASLAVLSVVAVRVVQLRQVGRGYPEEAAERVASKEEIEMVQQATGTAFAKWSVRQFVHGVAKMGGWLGRKCDGEPGFKTLWRGYQKLQTMIEGVRLHEQLLKSRATETAASLARPP